MSLQARYDETMSRADALLREKLRREEQALAAEDAEREDARRQRQRNNAEERREIGARYADAFQSFGTEPPMPLDDEAPQRFRGRLFNRLARKLPPDHELATVRADDLGFSATAYNNFEAMLLTAAKAEGLKPSFDNLPPSGELVQRVMVDPDTGERSIQWHGRDSFIKQMSRGGHRVLRVIDPKTRSVLFGAPFDVAR
jgi:hypothetical protein